MQLDFVSKVRRASAGLLPAVAVLFMLASAPMAAAAPAQTVSFGAPPWPGVTVKTEVVSQILNKLGYQTKTTNASYVIVMQSVGKGEINADLGIWMPSQKSSLEPLLKKGDVVKVATNINDAEYNIVVPDYVWKAGVHSIADLNKHGDKFDHKIYGIEAGNDGNEIVKSAIKKGTYGLSGWTLVPSSTSAMLAQAGRAIKAHKWVAFLGWKPHWMNIEYKLKYLKDPKKIWGGPSQVLTIANKQFLKDNPNVARFLKQFTVPAKVQSQWIYDFSYKNVDKKKVAGDWISKHPKTVASWLKGVKTADGKPASSVFSE